MKQFTALFIIISLLILCSSSVTAYPLDGFDYTGMSRLEGYRLAQQGKVRGVRLYPGALLNREQVDLRLLNYREVDLPEVDSDFADQVVKLLGDDADRYGIAVLDLSDLEQPRYGDHNGSTIYNPGSVGKLLVVAAVFQALADLYPDDIGARERILRETVITADSFINYDHHKVPVWHPGDTKIVQRPLIIGDKANLWTYLDWMLSASSNAAASMVMKHLLLIKQYGKEYPVTELEAEKFFRVTSKQTLAELLTNALDEPIIRSGLDPALLHQGKFFTREGKLRVGGRRSSSNAKELVRFLLRMEQGRVVDNFSSREIKRLLYMTQGRIRYASSPALAQAAVYFKSGSLYSCRPEPEFQCGKYRGNVFNFMNSVAVVEAPAGEPRLFYLVAITSNVLRENSAVAHQTLATRLHRLIEAYHLRKQRNAAQSGR